MDDANNELEPRASLRGKGRDILLGGLDLDDESAAASRAAAPAAAESAAPDEAVPNAEWLVEQYEFDLPPYAAAPEDQPAAEALPLHERRETAGAGEDAITYQPRPGVEELIPAAPEEWIAADEEGPARVEVPVLLPEETPEAPAPADQGAELSGEPEEWAAVLPDEAPPAELDAAAAEFRAEPIPALVPSTGQEGGLVVPERAIFERQEQVTDPFAPVLRRQPSSTLFAETSAPDKELLDTLVDDDRLKKLWQQIDALHEELIREVQGDRGTTDAYQQELLQASSLLLESRANYDDARAIVYRIRADMNRQRRVTADVQRYRPLLLNYYLGWGIAWLVLFALKGLFSGVAEAVGIDILAAMYHPMLFGVLGALVSGYLTLERHTTRLRDFDPMHISWYLFNPVLGGVMGLLMFLLYSIANQDVLQASATRLEMVIAWILCALAGMNQNTVLRQMNDLLKRFRRG